MAIIEGLFVELGVGSGTAATLSRLVRLVVTAIVIYLIGTRLFLPLLGRSFDARSLEGHVQQPLLKLAWFLVLFATIGIALAVAGLGFLLLSLTTIAAAATLAIGFALQDVLRNFVAGIFIFTERPFRIGDWIEWDEESGVVEDISLRVTRVRTFDNELLTVPNSILTDDVLKNPVAKDRLRLKFLFGIGYDSDIDRAIDIILEAADDHPDVLSDPEPAVRLTELGDSAVGLQSRIWIADPSRSDFIKVRGEFVADAKRRLEAADIEIPYPKRDLVGAVEVSNGDRPPGSDGTTG